jgi:hypothetical protein
MLTFVTVGICVVWMSTWFVTTPDPNSCIGIPDASYPVLDYRGFDNAWVYNGAIVGYSAAEDATCMTTRPIDD